MLNIHDLFKHTIPKTIQSKNTFYNWIILWNNLWNFHLILCFFVVLSWLSSSVVENCRFGTSFTSVKDSDFSRFHFLMYSEHFHDRSRPRNKTYNSVKPSIIITIYLIYFAKMFLLFVRTGITSGYKCRDRERRESCYLANISSVPGVNISLRVKSHRNESLFSCAKGEETPSNPTQNKNMAKQVVTTICFVLFHCIISYWAFMSSCSIHSSRKIIAPAIARYFGTKGRYEEVNTYLIGDILATNNSLVTLPSSKCSEIHLTAIIRHGTRYPTIKNIQKMREFYDLVVSDATGNLNYLSEIKSQWKMWYTDNMDGRLVDKGREDHRHLAQRLIKWFPSLLTDENVLRGRVKLITSSKHRCVNSTIAFREGLMKGLGTEGNAWGPSPAVTTRTTESSACHSVKSLFSKETCALFSFSL